MNNYTLLSVSIISLSALIYLLLRKSKKKMKHILVDIDTVIPLKVITKEALTPDSYLIRCELPHLDHSLGLPIGNCIYINAVINGKECMKPYTPISLDMDHGKLELAIKVYRAGSNPAFPQGGLMSSYIEALKIGDILNISGPSGQFIYKGHGNVLFGKFDKKKRIYTHMTMIAMGSGITPMYQIIKYISIEKSDKTKISLIYGNHDYENIMLREQLDHLQEVIGRDQFKLTYVLSRPDASWKGCRGRISANIIKQHSYPANKKSIALVCGSEEMRVSMSKYLSAIKYADENIFEF